jgi:hypothetical protein
MVIALANSTDLLVPKYDSIFLISGTVAAEGAFAIAGMHRMVRHWSTPGPRLGCSSWPLGCDGGAELLWAGAALIVPGGGVCRLWRSACLTPGPAWRGPARRS